MNVYATDDCSIVVQQADYTETLCDVAAAGGCDLVLTSPPYDDARTYGNAVSWRLEDYQRLGDATFAALVPGGHALVVLDSPVREWRKGVGTERGFTPWKVMLDWAERVGFRVPDRLAYGRYGAAGSYIGRFRNDWEPLLWFQRPGARGYFDKWAITEPAKHKVKVGHFASNRTKAGGTNVRGMSGRAVEEGVKHRGTYWPYGNAPVSEDHKIGRATKHPARFCARFAEDVVRCFAPAGGLVVDPMVGSGTTAIACVRHGRRFAGGDAFADEQGRPWAEIAFEQAARERHAEAA